MFCTQRRKKQSRDWQTRSTIIASDREMLYIVPMLFMDGKSGISRKQLSNFLSCRDRINHFWPIILLPIILLYYHTESYISSQSHMHRAFVLHSMIVVWFIVWISFLVRIEYCLIALLCYIYRSSFQPLYIALQQCKRTAHTNTHTHTQCVF